MFSRVLVANRGEIACRVIATLSKLEIESVAVYSYADRDSLHCKLATFSVAIGPAEASHSYLNIPKIIQTALENKCDAIHPGYGFLSENANFAKACEEANLVFIGPDSETIAKMGSKSGAKEIMQSAKVPVIPGYHGEEQDDETLIIASKKIGYPLLIKASAGGGGKGMRVVNDESEFLQALGACKREAQASFGSSDVILEKFLCNPRHVEVQIAADNFGTCLHLFERDCSIQRRQQKVIEESPAIAIPDRIRKKMHKTAINAARAINYKNLGTIEFLVDDHHNFYFMEMNTRLQVEHPITELITGLDLVELQLKIASNQPIGISQSDIHTSGYAIEARIYAEDPSNEFLPVTGTLGLVKFSEQARIDSGISSFDKISIFYDPILAKVSSYGIDRNEAISNLHQALKNSYIPGITTNINFIMSIISHPKYLENSINTNFIANHPELIAQFDNWHNAIVCVATAIFMKDTTLPLHNENVWFIQNYLHNGQASCSHISLEYKKKIYTVSLSNKGTNLEISFDNNSYNVSKYSITGDLIHILINNHEFTANYNTSNDLHFVRLEAQDFNIYLPNFKKASLVETPGLITSPMPAKIIDILVKKDQLVNNQEPLIILEAMKMEHTITTSQNATVTDIKYSKGDTVEEGDILMQLEFEKDNDKTIQN